MSKYTGWVIALTDALRFRRLIYLLRLSEQGSLRKGEEVQAANVMAADVSTDAMLRWQNKSRALLHVYSRLLYGANAAESSGRHR
jgi:hypothetical protein